eukprot:jgi/Hompol1/1792/HPOL_005022-RA
MPASAVGRLLIEDKALRIFIPIDVFLFFAEYFASHLAPPTQSLANSTPLSVRASLTDSSNYFYERSSQAAAAIDSFQKPSIERLLPASLSKPFDPDAPLISIHEQLDPYFMISIDTSSIPQAAYKLAGLADDTDDGEESDSTASSRFSIPLSSLTKLQIQEIKSSCMTQLLAMTQNLSQGFTVATPLKEDGTLINPSAAINSIHCWSIHCSLTAFTWRNNVAITTADV